MAYEKVYEFTDKLVEYYNKSDSIKKYFILEIMLDYYNTVLQQAKFKSQKEYCKKKFYEINQPFAEGYFKKNKK